VQKKKERIKVGTTVKVTQPRLKTKILIFSITLFLIILVAGSLTFFFSMRQINRANNSHKLSQMVDMKRIELANSVDSEIAIVLKMADSPLIKRYFQNPESHDVKKFALDEIDSYQNAFDSNIIFYMNDIDKIFYYAGNDPYWIDADDPENYWYNMTLYETEVYNFNINYNPELNAINLWINAPVFDENHRPIGMVGSGIILSSFVEEIYESIDDNVELYMFNSLGEITGAKNVALVEEKKDIQSEIAIHGIDVFSKIKNLAPNEVQTFDIPSGNMALGTLPSLDWYTVAIWYDSISDYNNPLTALFLMVLALLLVIFIIFNFFVAKFNQSQEATMISLEETNLKLEDAFNVLETTQRTVAAIFESNPHMNVMFDERLNIIDCNPSAVELMGFDTKEDFINGFTSLMLNSIPETQMDGKPSLSMPEVLTITVRDGYYKDEIDLAIRGEVRIFDLEIKRIPYGDSFAILGYMTDLTDRREKEDALALRTAELEATQRTVSAMFESNPHMNLMLDNNFNVIDCNPAIIKFMGFTNKEEMINGFYERLNDSIPEFQPNGQLSLSVSDRFITAAKDGYSKFESELYINHKNVIVDIEIRRIPYGDSFALVGYITDLTTYVKRKES